MKSLKDFFLRATPIAGTIIVAGYFVALTRERLRRQKEPLSFTENVDEAQLYSFMSKSGKKIDINNWENKRVYRAWEDDTKTK
ncbi:unnamed protein product [Mesocestoides corti]|uniref:Cytochrome c oxidase assembly protein COX16 homolog, mitochondrial n=1 Tax=Mesocestoides corti TaxID=53468 RepID=A0A0R3U9F6_MESCO|nr:unnamed protein product [Mesocestoides corti]